MPPCSLNYYEREQEEDNIVTSIVLCDRTIFSPFRDDDIQSDIYTISVILDVSGKLIIN